MPERRKDSAIAAVARKHGRSQRDVQDALALGMEVIGEALLQEGRIQIHQFGTFTALVPASAPDGAPPHIHFKPAKALSERLG